MDNETKLKIDALIERHAEIKEEVQKEMDSKADEVYSEMTVLLFESLKKDLTGKYIYEYDGTRYLIKGIKSLKYEKSPLNNLPSFRAMLDVDTVRINDFGFCLHFKSTDCEKTVNVGLDGTVFCTKIIDECPEFHEPCVPDCTVVYDINANTLEPNNGVVFAMESTLRYGYVVNRYFLQVEETICSVS